MMNNQKRVASVSEFLTAFISDQGLDGEDPETIAGDLICNIMHWVAQHLEAETGQMLAMKAVQSGIGHYATEAHIDYSAAIVDEIGPDALVSITVNCNGETWYASTGNEPFIC